MDNDVDNISTSFAIPDNNQDMKKPFKAADSKGILLLCSTHDEGPNVETCLTGSLVVWGFLSTHVIVRSCCWLAGSSPGQPFREN
jgi:hypothetical protein